MDPSALPTQPLLPGLVTPHDQAVYYLSAARRACYITAIIGYVLYGLEIVGLFVYGLAGPFGHGIWPVLYMSHVVPTLTLLPVAVCFHLVWLLPLVGADGTYFPSIHALRSLRQRALTVLILALISAIVFTPWFTLIQPFIFFPHGGGLFGTAFEIYLALLLFYCPPVYLFFLGVLGTSSFLLYWCDKGLVLADALAGPDGATQNGNFNATAAYSSVLA